jgi:hypothetical protein
MRIALIHALPVSIAPIEEAFERLWPEASTANLTDDSLAGDLAAAGTLPPEMTDRFLALARYSASTGADAILFTCSAFGPCIEACAEDLSPLPVLKPNEALIEECAAIGGVLDALFAGDRESHDQAAAEVAVAELGDCDVIALAQFSLSPAATLVAEKTGKPVLTTPDTSVIKLRRMFGVVR